MVASSSFDEGRLGARCFGPISNHGEKCFAGREFCFVRNQAWAADLAENAAKTTG